MDLRRCPKLLPSDFIRYLNKTSEAWAKSDVRPRIKPSIIKKWDKLIDAWIANDKLPLFIRKHNKNRGAELKHKKSHRTIVPADNGPAHWAMFLALERQCPSIKELRQLIDARKIPVAMALKSEEKKKCKYDAKRERRINNADWKLCHIEDVRLEKAYGKKLEDVDLQSLIEHFRRFLSPRNMFLVPKEYSGIGELAEMRNAIKDADNR